MTYEITRVYTDRNGRIYNQDHEDVTQQLYGGEVPEHIIDLESQETAEELKQLYTKLKGASSDWLVLDEVSTWTTTTSNTNTFKIEYPNDDGTTTSHNFSEWVVSKPNIVYTSTY